MNVNYIYSMGFSEYLKDTNANILFKHLPIHFILLQITL